MRFYHTKCGGEIDVKKRQCTRCKKRWNPISFRLDPVGIRPIVGREKPKFSDSKPNPVPRSYASWVDKVPKVVDLGLTRALASKLPKWPRWARLLATGVFVLIVVVVIILVRR